MRLAKVAMVVMIGMVLISSIACKPETHNLYTSVSGQGVVSPSSGIYEDGELVSIAAVPASGWVFSHWGGHVSGNENPVSIRMNFDSTIQAYFVEIQVPTPTPIPTPTPTSESTPTPTPTTTAPPTPTPEPTAYVAPEITTAAELKGFLEESYSTCATSLGTTSFTFDIYENNYITSPYDYWIQVEYDMSFFYDLQYSNDISTEMNHMVAGELQNCMETLARDVISRMPNTKFYGGYYQSWYRYPSIQVDLITRHYYSWCNYNPPGVLAAYDEAVIDGLIWWDLIDDSLLR